MSNFAAIKGTNTGRNCEIPNYSNFYAVQIANIQIHVTIFDCDDYTNHL